MSVDFFWVGPSMMASRPCVFAFGVGADVVGLAVWWVLYRCLIISPPCVFTEEEQNKCPLFALHDSCGEGKELRTSGAGDARPELSAGARYAHENGDRYYFAYLAFIR